MTHERIHNAPYSIFEAPVFVYEDISLYFLKVAVNSWHPHSAASLAALSTTLRHRLCRSRAQHWNTPFPRPQAHSNHCHEYNGGLVQVCRTPNFKEREEVPNGAAAIANANKKLFTDGFVNGVGCMARVYREQWRLVESVEILNLSVEIVESMVIQ